MNGLDKIEASIKAEAKERADKIMQEAMHTVTENGKIAEENLEAWKLDFNEKLSAELEKIKQRANSANRQARKSAVLGVRNDVISDAIQTAKAQIEALPIDDYFNLMLSLFHKNSRALDGKISFSEADNTRIPKDFIGRCKASLKSGSIELCESTSTIKNGFLLIYGKTEQNCSIDSIFESNKNLFRDEVNKCLISEAG